MCRIDEPDIAGEVLGDARAGEGVVAEVEEVNLERELGPAVSEREFQRRVVGRDGLGIAERSRDHPRTKLPAFANERDVGGRCVGLSTIDACGSGTPLSACLQARAMCHGRLAVCVQENSVGEPAIDADIEGQIRVLDEPVRCVRSREKTARDDDGSIRVARI